MVSSLTLRVTFAVAMLLGSFAAEAQQAERVARIAFLSTTSSPDSPTTAAFRQGLRELGYIEGQNIIIEWRWGAGSTERFPEFAAEAAKLNVDLIVAANDAAGRAAQQVTKSVPIVIAIIGDPVASGFAATLGRPGGNITGSTTQASDLGGKALQFLKEAVPNVSRVALLVDTNDQSYRQGLKETERAAGMLGIQPRVHEISNPTELNGAFAASTKERVGAVFLVGGTMFYANRAELAEQALKNRLPMMCGTREMVDAGCLMSYSASLTERFRRAAHIVDKILKGAKPAALPIEQPTTFELVINMKTAKALGLTIPASMLLGADQLIE
jgi:putative tryptophan/tyrosine transport system substrate-binding protein